MHTAEKRAGVGKDEKEFPLASDVLIIWNLWRGDPSMGNFGDATILKTFGEVPENLDEL